MRRQPTIVIAAALASLLSAACATTRYTQSAVVAVPTGVKGGTGSRGSIELDGLRIRVEPRDRATRGLPIPSLELRIVLRARELGYSFDPGQVVLRSADGREWRPTAGGYRPVERETAVDVGFDAVVGEGATLDLVVGGLARGTKPLAPVTLRLARRKGTSYDRLYWLEAIGWFLAPVSAM